MTERQLLERAMGLVHELKEDNDRLRAQNQLLRDGLERAEADLTEFLRLNGVEVEPLAWAVAR